ncbi:MAG: ABC transporter ATP-binding protein [Deltaproteobacteria bacterium]|nr:ABC transporter ATP-binding protein [Deltaproteobacteria bacterium]
MIQLKNIHKSFKDQKVLNGLSLEIPEGKTTVILGPSGEGKSVLLKTILGLLPPDEGEVYLEGEELYSLKERELTAKRRLFGMVFQNAALFDSLNVYENLAFPLRIHTDFPEKEIQAQVEEKLAQVDLSGRESKLPSELSGGMRKRVGLARALMLRPKIVLFDEPTTGLDPLLTQSIDDLIVDTQKRFNLTCVVVSHDVASGLRMAHNVAMLKGGTILEQGPPQEFVKSDKEFVKKFLNAAAIKT